MRIPARFIGFLAVFSPFCFWFTFSFTRRGRSRGGKNLSSTPLLKIVLGALSVSFLRRRFWRFVTQPRAAGLLPNRSGVARLVSFLFFAAALSWIVLGIALLAGWHADFHRLWKYSSARHY